MSKKNNLNHECINALKRQIKYGESKYEAKQRAKKEALDRGEQPPKNVKGHYSCGTTKTYEKHTKHFIKYCLKEHKSEIKHYSDCRKYVEEYLQNEIDRGLSASTVHTRACAVCSSYDIKLADLDIKLPPRLREDITRTRGYNTSKYKDIDERYREIKEFIRATGCRRGELLALRKEDFKWSQSGKNCYVYKRGKGGVERWCLVNPKYNKQVAEMFDRQPAHRVNGENRIFKKSEIPHSAIHDLRADYARDLYELYKRAGAGNGKRYYCKYERKGDSFDRGILEKVSENMGHHRIDVVVNNYLYGMHGRN